MAEDAKKAAESRRGEIRKELGDPPYWPEGWTGRWEVLDDLDPPMWMSGVAVLVALGTAAAYVVLDVVLLRMIARMICHRPGHRFRLPLQRRPEGDGHAEPAAGTSEGSAGRVTAAVGGRRAERRRPPST